MEIIEAFAVKNKCYCVCCSELIHILSRKGTNIIHLHIRERSQKHRLRTEVNI